MTEENQQPTSSSAEDFALQAESSRPGQLREIFALVWHEKKWFLTPIIIIILVAGVFLTLSGTAAAPFIYTLF